MCHASLGLAFPPHSTKVLTTVARYVIAMSRELERVISFPNIIFCHKSWNRLQHFYFGWEVQSTWSLPSDSLKHSSCAYTERIFSTTRIEHPENFVFESVNVLLLIHTIVISWLCRFCSKIHCITFSCLYASKEIHIFINGGTHNYNIYNEILLKIVHFFTNPSIFFALYQSSQRQNY